MVLFVRSHGWDSSSARRDASETTKVDDGTDLTFLKTGRGAVREGDARVEVDVLLRSERFLPAVLEDGAKLGDSFLRSVGGKQEGQWFAFSKISRRVSPRTQLAPPRAPGSGARRVRVDGRGAGHEG